MALQVNFSTAQFAQQTKNRIEAGIRANECNLRSDQKIEKANKTPNELAIAIDRINELTAQIRSFNDYDGLRAIVVQHLNDLRQDIDEKLKEKSKLYEKIAPLLKLPLTPWAVVKFIKKMVLKDILPELQAAITMAIQIIRLLQALNNLQIEIREALERLEEFIKSLPDFILQEAQKTLDQAVISLQNAIQDAILDAICGELKREDATIDDVRDVLSLIQQGKQAISDINQLVASVSNDLSSDLSTIDAIQNDIIAVTGQPPGIDTSSNEAFVQSVESGSAGSFVTDAETFADNIDLETSISNVREFNIILTPPLLDSNVAFGTICTSNGYIASNFSEWSVAKQLDNPTSNLVFDVTVNDVSTGNVTITTTGEVIKTTANNQVNLAINDIINIVTPPDASIAAPNTRLYFTIKINEIGTGIV
jgi:hypothetical protein